MMNSPYMGRFKVTQEYKGADHDGLDLVGIDSKEIHSTVNGVVISSGYNVGGFGNRVMIQKDGTSDVYIYAHMSKCLVNKGDRVRITDIIGIEGNTGHSFGSHCHYCVRTDNRKGQHKDISAISKIPNVIGTYDDGYRPQDDTPPEVERQGVTWLKTGSWNVRADANFDSKVVRVVKGRQTVTYVDVRNGFYKLRDGNYISVKACE